jgi:hypothetical protein
MITASRQSGNVIMIVLIGIVLFAALTYAVTRSMNGGGDFGNNEKYSLQANQFLSFGNQVETAVKALTANGCLDTQINFENSDWSGYANSNAPSDKSCNVFDQAGGGLTYIQPSSLLLDETYSASADYKKWIFTGRFCFLDVGTGGSYCASNNSELAMVLNHVSINACNKINSLFNTTLASNNGAVLVKFTGAYGTDLLLNYSSFSGKRVFCYTYNNDNKLVYTLLPR